MYIQTFSFNPFSENTYLLYDDSLEAVLIDPGCAFAEEERELKDFIRGKGLTVKNVLLTHAHVDHVMGCKFVCKEFYVSIFMHKNDLFLLQKASQIGMMYGFPVSEPPDPEGFLNHGDVFRFGKTELEVVFTPGHSPGSITFIHHSSKSILCGDVLFRGSIGRTDLPGGNMETLLHSIRTQILSLSDDYKVFSGHGPVTSVGAERKNNPFLKQ